MTRALRDPRWLGGLAVAVVFAVVCVLLAQWQLDRRVQRAERNAAVLQNYDSAPVDLDDAVGLSGDRDAGDRDAGAALAREPAPQEQWTPVRLLGRYDPAGTVLVRNRPQVDTNGYQVAVPFDATRADGSTVRLLLVRGWVPAGAAAAGPATVPDPPSGQVEVVARLRTGESAATRTAPAGQTYRLDLPVLLGPGTGGSGPPAVPGRDPAVLTGAYGVVATEDGTPPAAMATLERPDVDPGPHLAYGVQWYLFAVAGLVLWGVLATRHGAEVRPSSAAGPDRGSAWVYDPGR